MYTCWKYSVILSMYVSFSGWPLCGDQFISSAAEQARQSISDSASKHKWFTVLIASCLPHELPDSSSNGRCRHCTGTPVSILSVCHQY